MGTLRGGDGRGAVAIELGLVVPVLFLLVAGIVEFGFIFNRYNSVAHAAREGVRQMSVGKDAATSEAKAEASAPDLAATISCTPSYPSSSEVRMTCSAVYDLSLWLISKPITLSSTAVMRKE